MKHSYNQKTGKYYSCKIRNVNIYLNENEEKVWNELPKLYTNSQRIEHFINFYINIIKKKHLKQMDGSDKMSNRKYCEDCQEDNYDKVIGNNIVWIFPDDRYTKEEVNFIINECSNRELKQNFKAQKRLVCENCLDKYC